MKMATALSAKGCSSSSAILTRKRDKPCIRSRKTPLTVRSSQDNRSGVGALNRHEVPLQSRRATLGFLAGVTGIAVPIAPSYAAYGEAANIFGKVTNKAGHVPYNGDGYTLVIPSKWVPSKEREFPSTELRYEDVADNVSHLLVIAKNDGKRSIEDYGSPESFLESISYLLGRQVFTGETISEGGFARNRVSAASLIDVKESTDKQGKKYYKYELLTRAADNNQGGRHQLISAAVGRDGKLYVLKVQVGDKRWFRGGVNRDARATVDSFTVA